MHNPKLWSRGYARSSIMGPEPTMNPTPPAAMLLGMNVERPLLHRSGQARRSLQKKRHPRTANPTAAELALSVVPGGGIIGAAKKVLTSLGIGSKYTKDTHVNRFAAAQAGGNTVLAQSLIKQAADHAGAPIADAAEWAGRFESMRVIASPENKALMQKLRPAAGGGGAAAAAPSTAAQLLGVLGQPGTIRALAQVAKPRASRRARYPTYSDRYGRQRYSTRPPELGEMRLPAGATPSPGTPYSFFQGAVGKGGAAATAGQVATAAAAGIGAYLVTRRLLQYLGGRAQAKEEAGVAAAKALHDSLEDYKAHTGKYPPPAERAAMKEAYRAKLVELGYNPDTFTRTRSRTEAFLEDYNPLN